MFLTVFKIKFRFLHSAPVALCDLALHRFSVWISCKLPGTHTSHVPTKPSKSSVVLWMPLPYSLIPPPSSPGSYSSFRLASGGSPSRKPPQLPYLCSLLCTPANNQKHFDHNTFHLNMFYFSAWPARVGFLKTETMSFYIFLYFLYFYILAFR